jgi:signal transduction histidine kinase
MNRSQHADLPAFVRAVRHDANNALSAALGHVQLLLEEDDIDEWVRDSLLTIEREIRRAADQLVRLREVDRPSA